MAAILLASAVYAQTATEAGWIGGSSGVWGSPDNWQCTFSSGASPGPCVPGASTLVGDPSGDTITVNTNVQILEFTGVGTTLISNGQSLNATDGFNIASGGSVQMTGGSINVLALSGSVDFSDNATVGGGSLPSALSLTSTSTIDDSNYTGTFGVSSGATLTVASASSLTTTLASVGNPGGGTMSISGSLWNVGVLDIGEEGAAGGTGNVTLGGLSVTNVSTTIQILEGSLTVNGGTIATPSGTLGNSVQIGTLDGTGSGQMTIEKGGQVALQQALLFAGSTGTASLSLDGSSSALTLSRELAVRGGAVTVTNGATLSPAILYDESGTVDLKSGSVLTASAVTVGQVVAAVGDVIGSSGVATLTLEGGATGSATGGVAISTTSGANGTVTLTGDGTSLTSDAEIYVGVMGTGTLNVEDGATGKGSAALYIGYLPNSNGTVSISDAPSTWTNAEPVHVGYNGSGALFIAEGGVLSSDADSNGVSGYVGEFAGSSGTVSIDGSVETGGLEGTISSEWKQSGAIYVGDAGTGSVSITDGGTLTTNSNGLSSELAAVIGVQAGGKGSISVSDDDSEWDADGIVQVGAAGKGTLTIKDQAEVNTGGISVGVLAGGEGTITMTGGKLNLTASLLEDSALPGGGVLIVGDAGEGTLTVEPYTNADTVVNDEGQILSSGGVIGNQAGSKGTVVIGSGLDAQGTGPLASSWTMSGALIVGESGTGSLTIGGTVQDDTATIGDGAQGSGSVEVDNGGLWLNSGSLTVGHQGTADLDIEAGGLVSVGGGAQIGGGSGSTGTVEVQGQLNVTGAIAVGESGTGTLTIENGGAVASRTGYVGDLAGSTGTVTISGSNTHGGSSWTADGTLYVGAAGTGTLTASDGAELESRDGVIGQQSGSVGTVTLTGTGTAWKVTLPGGTGTVTVGSGGSQGTLNVQNGASLVAQQINVLSGGLLNGEGGSITGNLANAGGTVTAGDATGVLTLNGNFTQSSGSTIFEIDGTGSGQFDRLQASGTATLGAGQIDVRFGSGFVPTAGESFDVLTARAFSLGSITVDATGLPSSLRVGDELTASGLELVVVESAVPEPPILWLIASGFVSVWPHRAPRRAPPPRLGWSSDARRDTVDPDAVRLH